MSGNSASVQVPTTAAAESTPEPVTTTAPPRARIVQPADFEAVDSAQPDGDFEGLQRIKVKVTRPVDGSRIAVTLPAGVDMPPTSMVLAHLPEEYRKTMARRHKSDNRQHSVQDVARYYPSIPVTAWSNAIAQAIMQQLDTGTESEVDIPRQGPMYMSTGGMLYQLNPVAQVSTASALATMKRKLKDKVQLDVAAIMQSAKAAARAVLERATEKEMQVDDLLDDLAANGQRTPPQEWVAAGVPLKWASGNFWSVGIVIKFSVLGFVVHPDTENAVWWYVPDEQSKTAQPIRSLIWVPVDATGHYGMTTIRVDNNFPELPHMTWSAACLSVGDSPDRLTPLTLLQLKSGIERAFSIVNLSSLYRGIEGWRDRFKAYIPPELMEAFYDRQPNVAMERLYKAELARRRHEAAAQAPQPSPTTPAPVANDIWTTRS